MFYLMYTLLYTYIHYIRKSSYVMCLYVLYEIYKRHYPHVMPQEYINKVSDTHYDLCTLFFLSNSFTSWSWQESRSAPRSVRLSMNSCVEAAVSLLWRCYAWHYLIWQDAHYRSRSALKISVQVTRSLQWTRWPMCLFLSGPSNWPYVIPMCRVPMIKGQKRSVTWCHLHDALWWACEILWIQGVAYWKRWRIRTCWDSRPAGECLLL